ncbi:uncharacterized protein LOC142339864 [Convolutriloba macropyga]|uniref:uncharacterized protein LOC142339864 n=1 Tax=Convolutriloba macropyga TaxID=536237 RepID=UPI003F52670F
MADNSGFDNSGDPSLSTAYGSPPGYYSDPSIYQSAFSDNNQSVTSGQQPFPSQNYSSISANQPPPYPTTDSAKGGQGFGFVQPPSAADHGNNATSTQITTTQYGIQTGGTTPYPQHPGALSPSQQMTVVPPAPQPNPQVTIAYQEQSQRKMRLKRIGAFVGFFFLFIIIVAIQWGIRGALW